jgi:hypothetical protein
LDDVERIQIGVRRAVDRVGCTADTVGGTTGGTGGTPHIVGGTPDAVQRTVDAAEDAPDIAAGVFEGDFCRRGERFVGKGNP